MIAIILLLVFGISVWGAVNRKPVAIVSEQYTYPEQPDPYAGHPMHCKCMFHR